MYDNKAKRIDKRIVSIFQPHVRPIVRGKEKNKTEFGSKINVSEVNGFTRIDHLSWEAYNESTDLKKQVENYRKVYGCYPKTVLVDQIYLTRENRKYLKGRGIKIYGKPLGRPVRQPKKDGTAALPEKEKSGRAEPHRSKVRTEETGIRAKQHKGQVTRNIRIMDKCHLLCNEPDKTVTTRQQIWWVFCAIFEMCKILEKRNPKDLPAAIFPNPTLDFVKFAQIENQQTPIMNSMR